MITIFKAGEYDYSDLGINKPVHITVDNLLEIASKTAKSDITMEHSKEILGVMDNFVVNGSELQANRPDGIELKDKGFSPEIVCDFIDYGSYFGIKNVRMPRIGYTGNPRSKILYNSIVNNPNGEESEMAEDTELRKVLQEKAKLQEEIGVLKSHKKQLEKSNKDKDKEIERIKESYKDTDSRLKDYEALEKKARSYDELMASHKDELIKEIAGDNKALAEKYKDFSVEALETVKETQNITREAQGITTQQQGEMQGQEGGSDNDSGEGEYSWDEFEEDFKASGL